MSRRASMELRVSEQELSVFQDAAGPRRLSEWVRSACREKLAREGASQETRPVEVRPSPARVPRPSQPRASRHHPRCTCAICQEAPA